MWDTRCPGRGLCCRTSIAQTSASRAVAPMIEPSSSIGSARSSRNMPNGALISRVPEFRRWKSCMRMCSTIRGRPLIASPASSGLTGRRTSEPTASISKFSATPRARRGAANFLPRKATATGCEPAVPPACQCKSKGSLCGSAGQFCTTYASVMRQDNNEHAAALVVAHPGHEVRVAGWYESARPRLFILTKGSRNGGRGRLLSARRLADRTGAKLGSLCGRYRDRDIYAAILARDPTPFLEWTAELTDAFAAFAPAMVVTDAWQMYNVGHDLTHVMARVAAERAAARLRRPIEVVEFDVVPGAFAVDRPRGAEAFRVTLDDAALLRKQASVDRYDDLRQEFEQVLACEGRDAQRQEVFRSVVPLDALVPAPGVIPPYEAYGEQRVAAGIYRDVIRWRDHVSGIIEAIRTAEPRPMAIACAS